MADDRRVDDLTGLLVAAEEPGSQRQVFEHITRDWPADGGLRLARLPVGHVEASVALRPTRTTASRGGGRPVSPGPDARGGRPWWRVSG